MDKQELIKKIQDPAVVDYTYGIGFFVVFIFFVIVIIGPNIATVFQLRQQYEDLKVINSQYATTISTINRLQSLLSSRRNDFPLLSESLPDQIKISQVVEDLYSLPISVQDEQEVVYPSFVVGTQKKSIDKKAKKDDLKSFPIQITLTGSQEYVSSILEQLASQKRLKTISKYSLSSSSESSSSAVLDTQVEIQVYFQ